MSINLFGESVEKELLLVDKYIEPPFSVIDGRSPRWLNRKRKWKALGIKSHLGREGVKVFNNAAFRDKTRYKTAYNYLDVSVFDPALCELLYYWYCPKNGTILDPFAGGSVRGIVANYMGYNYTGIDIRQEQIDSNREQAINILPINRQPNYYVGDSNVVLDELTKEYDFVFSCPPYYDLEVYSDLEGDISNKDYSEFLAVYKQIVKKSINKLKSGRYACFVVGDIRDENGYYRDFISHTKSAFINAGALLYNEAIYLEPLGAAALRSSRAFDKSKKLTKVHQNVLIFKKP
jgi:DNA modification methylase